MSAGERLVHRVTKGRGRGARGVLLVSVRRGVARGPRLSVGLRAGEPVDETAGEGVGGCGPLSRAALPPLSSAGRRGAPAARRGAAGPRPLRRRCPETGAARRLPRGRRLHFPSLRWRCASAPPRPVGRVLICQSSILTRSLSTVLQIRPVRVGSRSLSRRSTGCAGDPGGFECVLKARVDRRWL